METEHTNTKVCPHCNQEKLAEEFGKRKRVKSTGEVYYGLRSKCIPCERLYQRKWKGLYYAANKDEVNRKRKVVREADPEKTWGMMIKTRYGITSDQYYKVLDAQGGGCGICGTPNADRKGQRRLHVDHDHATGSFRGLLCARCNTALGKFDDDVGLLQKAILYLKGSHHAGNRTQEHCKPEPLHETHIRGS